MSQHTPGPWHTEWVSWGSERDLKVVSRDGVLLTMTRTGLLSEEVMEHNARLIAAAPEMYALLLEMVNQVEEAYTEGRYVPGPNEAIWLEKTRALLAKVEGEA